MARRGEARARSAVALTSYGGLLDNGTL